MKVIVPHAPDKLHETTEQVLESFQFWRRVRYVELTHDDAYRQLLRDLWLEGESFIIVEQDIVPWPGALEELWRCPCYWGSNTYKLHGGEGIHHGFGCTKITTALMARLPKVWDEPGHWSELDQRLWFAAREIGQEPHPHRPPVIHLNPRELHHAGDNHGA